MAAFRWPLLRSADTSSPDGILSGRVPRKICENHHHTVFTEQRDYSRYMTPRPNRRTCTGVSFQYLVLLFRGYQTRTQKHTCTHTYIHTLHYITLRYVALRYVTLRYVTLRYVTLHYITLHAYIHTHMAAHCALTATTDIAAGRHNRGAIRDIGGRMDI